MPARETTTTTIDSSRASAPEAPLRLRSKRLRRCLHLLHGKDSVRRVADARQHSDATTNTRASSSNSKRHGDRHDDVSAGAVSGSTASGSDSSYSFSSTGANEEEVELDVDKSSFVPVSPTTPIMHALSESGAMSGSAISPASRSRIPRRCSTDSMASSHSSEHSHYSTKFKGVKYSRDGAVVCCRFCDILRARDEDFLYEDDLITVFRPLSPVVESHILVVPRCHIRNVNMLTTDHFELLGRMKEVAAMVLQQLPQPVVNSNHCARRSGDRADVQVQAASMSTPQHIFGTTTSGNSAQSDAEFKFAFHAPPFNSIDHVHMHAFRRNEGSFGCFGSIKYRTETWWCRSFEQVINRLAVSSLKRQRRHHDTPQHTRLGSGTCMTMSDEAAGVRACS